MDKDGALAPILKHFLEAALEAEMDLHLDEEERGKGNRRNGKVTKQVSKDFIWSNGIRFLRDYQFKAV